MISLASLVLVAVGLVIFLFFFFGGLDAGDLVLCFPVPVRPFPVPVILINVAEAFLIS